MTDEMFRRDDHDVWLQIHSIGADNRVGANDIASHSVASSNGNIYTITDAAEEDLLRHPERE